MENGRMTLQQVYDWIQDNFLYYKLCGTNWQSSIRHNLSLGFFFKNTARGDNERGKGGYWELALDSRKTEWKRNRKSRKNRHQICGHSEKKTFKRLKFNSGSSGKRNKKFNDENHDHALADIEVDHEEECATQTEIILTVEAAQSEGYFSSRISEDTPVEFVHDFNLNNQVSGWWAELKTNGRNVTNPRDRFSRPMKFRNRLTTSRFRSFTWPQEQRQ